VYTFFPLFGGKVVLANIHFFFFFFFFFFRLAHLLVNFVGKRCAPFGEYIKQKVYTFCFNFLPQGLHLLPHNVVVYNLLHRYACGVAVDETFIVTGGYEPSEPDNALETVAEYSQTGFVRYLPNMIQRRYRHACSSFINANGDTVGIFLCHTNNISTN